MKSKSGMVGALALAMWQIACKHTKRDRLCPSASSQAGRPGRVLATLRRRTKKGSRKETDSIDEMISGILCIGILAANFFLSPTASWLKSQVTLAVSLNVVTARMKMLFAKPYVRYCK